MPQAQATPQQQPLTDEDLKKALETLLFITDHPLGLRDLCKITGVKDEARITALIGELKQAFESHSAVQLLEIAEGYQFATRPSFAPFVRKLFSDRMTMRLSTAAHETLSIIAYKQPLTRAEIEDIRGVEVIAALETLLEKRLIKVVGRKETVGRPLMYGTTEDFLRHFGLKNLEDLPPIDSFQPEPEAKAETPAAEAPAETPVETTPEAWEAATAAEDAQPEAVAEPAVEEAAPAEPESPAEEPQAEAPAEPVVEEGPKMKNLWGDETAEEAK
jgi:segregation and condensation protein B